MGEFMAGALWGDPFSLCQHLYLLFTPFSARQAFSLLGKCNLIEIPLIFYAAPPVFSSSFSPFYLIELLPRRGTLLITIYALWRTLGVGNLQGKKVYLLTKLPASVVGDNFPPLPQRPQRPYI